MTTPMDARPGAATTLPSINHLMMQLSLFASTTPAFGMTPDRLTGILAGLRRHPALDGFRLWLVGSSCDAVARAGDIDVIVSPARTGAPPSDAAIDTALWTARVWGLRHAQGAVSVDPVYRADGPRETLCPLPPDTILSGVHLLSPRRMQEALAGALPGHRLVGKYCIAFDRAAGKTNFYRKLPIRTIAGRPVRYLRPAVEVSAAPDPA